MNRMAFVILAIFSLLAGSQAFAPSQAVHRKCSHTLVDDSAPCNNRAFLSLRMAPKFVDGQWITQGAEDEPSAGYGTWKTLLMHGPKPALTRTFQPDDYEQAVLKFMAGDKCDRNVAQGNMDAYLRNPQDWQYSRMEEERRGIKMNRSEIKPDEIALVLIWSTGVLALVARGAYAIANGEDFYAFLRPDYFS